MQKKRCIFAGVLGLSLAARGADTPHWTQPYNIVWTEPGTNGLSSMPAGGGNIGLNVWAQKDGVLFYISSPDSFDANEVLTKLARLRVTVSPNPFADSLRQELELESNTVRVSGRTADGTTVSLSIRADAHQPVVHVEGTATKPVSVIATLELDDNWKMTARPFDNGVLWSRRVPAPSSYRAGMIAAWGLEPIADKVPDTLGNLTCGGLLVGVGFAPGEGGTGTNEGRRCSTAPLNTVVPVTAFALRAALRIAQDATPDAWTNEVRQLAARTDSTQAADRETSAAWWHAFWDRSRIVINPDSTKTNDPAWEVGRNYQLFRAMLGANSKGRHPTFFNGGFFLCHADPDSRNWAFCRFMAQNQRHLYWPLLKSGDADVLKVGTDFYARTAELQDARIKLKFGADGVIYDEMLNTMGLGNAPNKDGFNNYGHLRYHFTSGLEFVLMMIEAHRYFGADLKPCLPAIEGAARFFDTFYRKENKTRTSSELNEKGQLVIFPVNTLESSPDKINGTDSLSGLIAISEAVLALPEETIRPETRAYFEGFRKILPPIATYEATGKGTLISQQQTPSGGLIENGEMPQLYPVFPFGLYGVGKPNLEMARNTWAAERNGTGGNAFCWWQGNIWVARLGLTEEARRYALTKLRFPLDYACVKGGWYRGDKPARTRFPTLYDGGGGGGKGPCETPDMDHGGSAMVGLQDMLLQTDGKRILLLPAWPPEWDVDFKLHAPEQTTVEGKVRGGKVVALTVTPESRRDDVAVLPPYQDPTAFVAEPTSGEVPLPVRFDGTPAAKTLGKIVSCQWEFGDGAKAGDTTAAHTYEKAGTYKVSLLLKDDQGKTVTSRSTIIVTPIDAIPPTFSTVTAPGRADRCNVTFSEPVVKEDAETASNYAITPDVKVMAASLGKDGRTVTLTTSSLSLGVEYALTAKNVRDKARNPNAMAPDARKAFRYSGLYGWWKLDEGKGRVAADVSGNRLRGALQGGAGWSAVDGRVSVSFDGGKDSVLEIPESEEAIALPFTISFRVNPAAQKSATMFAGGGDKPFSILFLAEQMLDTVDVDVREEREEYLGVVMEEDGAIQLLSGLGQREGIREDAPKSVPLEVGQWQHVVLTFDGQKSVCYVNGKEKSTRQTKSLPARQADPSFRLGRVVQIGRLFRGLLSDFRIYRTALSPAQVQAVMKE